MKISRFVLTICACITIIASTGCGGVNNRSNQPINSPTPSSTTAATSRFIYGIITFETDNGYQGGSISSNGQVSPISTLSAPDAGLNQNIVPQIVADPKGRFLYALNVGTQHGFNFNPPGIVELQINRLTGALTPVPGGPLMFPEARDGLLAMEPSGRFLYQANAGNFDIYAIDQNTGRLTLASSSTAASLGNFIAISPDARFLFNANETSVESLAIGANGSLMVAQPPIPTGGSAAGLSGELLVSPDSRFLYVLNQTNLAVFSIGSAGMLSPVAGSPFTIDAGGTGLSITPDGKHLYIVFQNDSFSAKGYTFDPAAATLTPIPNASITDNVFSITIDASGGFAYVTENQALSTYRIDPATGSLTKISQAAQPIGDAQTMVVVQ
jgi:6-phosphogluconolactonase (cycloisomerase 2 family)